MAIESIEHTFFDIEVEILDPDANIHLIKILAIDGRRFTYQLHGILDEAAVLYIKSLIDAVCFGDMLIERNGSEFTANETKIRLKKHS